MKVQQSYGEHNYLYALLVVLALVLAACGAQAPAPATAPEDAEEEVTDEEAAEEEESEETSHGAGEWSYEGATGPENWGTLSPDYALCGDGESQSPVNISSANVGSADYVLEIAYQETPITLTNNGHTIQVNYEPGSTITFDGTTYELLQFHFHQMSEHAMDDELAAMELHLVHQDDAGNLAVIGVLIQPGEANTVAENFWGQWNTEEGEADLEDVTVNIADILPDTHSYYTYEGSLTTPPCSEGVRWIVMQNPIEFSQEQIDTYGEILAGTNRPVQAPNTRMIDAAEQ